LVDPRIFALKYTKATDLVGIDEAREELITRLTKEDDTSTEQRRVSIVGFGGLGKTALAKAVYNKLKAKGEFHCTAFVSVSRYPQVEKIFKELLYEFDETEYKDVINSSTPMELIMNLVREFLHNKRYARTCTTPSVHYMFIPWKYPYYRVICLYILLQFISLAMLTLLLQLIQ
jgi:disease resistance protein RPM1